MSLEVWVNDQLADLSASQEPPRIFRRAFDPDQLASAAGDYAISLKLPKTRRNLAILGNADDVQQAAAFARLGNVSVRIAVDGVEVIRGTLVINRITDIIDCGIVGDNIAWADSFNELSLRDILSLPCIDYTATANQGDGVTLWDVWNSDEADGLGVQFPLVSYGNFAADPTNTSINPINGVTTIAESAGVVDGAVLDNRSAWPLEPLELRPAAYVRDVVRAMFRDRGFDVEGDFFTDPNFADYVLPFVDSADQGPSWNFGRISAGNTLSTGEVYRAWRTTNPVNGTQFNVIYRQGVFPTLGFAEFFLDHTAVTDVDLGYSGGLVSEVIPQWRWPAADQSNRFRRVPHLFAPEAGNYRFRVSGNLIQSTLQQTGWTAPARLIMYLLKVPAGFFETLNLTADRNDSFNAQNDLDLPYRAQTYDSSTLALEPNVLDFFEKAMDVVSTSGGEVIYSPVAFELDSGCVALEKGEAIVPFIVLPTSNVTEPAVTRGASVTMTSVTRESVGACGGNDCLSVSRNLPDVTQSDFLNGLIRLFNLYIEAKGSRLGVWTRDGYYGRNDSAVPIIGEPVEINPPALPKQVDFKFAAEDGEALFDPGRYDARYTAESEQLRGTDSIEPIFAGTAQRIYTLPTQGTQIDVPTLNTRDELLKPLGELGDGTQQVRLSYTLRILKWKGLATRSVSDGLYVGTRKYRASYPTDAGDFVYPYAIQIDPDGDWLLSYADERSLLTEFYRKELRERERGLVLTVAAKLDAPTVQMLNPRVPVTLGGQVYRLLEIEGFDPTGKRLTKVKLAKA